jgi:hypothetical protein
VINQGFGDFAASPYAGQEVFDAFSRCSAGGDSGAPPNYVILAKAFPRYSGSPEVTDASIPGASHFPILERAFSLLVGATNQWLKNRIK